MENIFVEFLPPWVETGIQPAFYDKESGTVLQQTARMYARVNMLIRMFNKLSKETKETVEEYITKFNELHDYVNDYFDNLDVQEEINNKLDAMVEAGTLQEIIAEYLDANVAWTFDTVTDMKTATNLVAGSYARTLGFHTINDGGGATYFITDTGTADEMSVIAISDLYANLVITNSEVNVKQFGAYGDDNHDDSSAINACIDFAYNHNCSVFIPSGTFLANSTIYMYGKPSTTDGCITIKGNGRSSTIIKASDALTNVIEINPYGTGTTSANMFIRDFAVSGDSIATNGINIKGNNFTNSRIENLYIYNCSGAGITNGTSFPNVYLTSFIKIRVYQCNIGIQLGNGTNTSLRIADCYTVSCDNGYLIKGNYSTFENNCCDHATEKCFQFTSYTGTILNPGSESPHAEVVFDFTRTNATVINPWTYGNLTDNDAIHIYVKTVSNVKFVGGKILIDPNTADVNGTANGKLYQLAADSSITFDGTRYSNYNTDNTYNEYTNVSSDENRYGNVSKRYGGIITYVGRDTSSFGGKLNNENKSGNLVANAIYFGLGDQPRYGANGYDYRWKKNTTQGDILLSRNVKNIGGIGWVQGDDMTAEGASTYWTGGTYYKIPVIMSGSTSDRPTINLTSGQMYFDTTLGKPIWFKTGSTWVDATGANV